MEVVSKTVSLEEDWMGCKEIIIYTLFKMRRNEGRAGRRRQYDRRNMLSPAHLNKVISDAQSRLSSLNL